jgi:hypothetical protein
MYMRLQDFFSWPSNSITVLSNWDFRALVQSGLQPEAAATATWFGREVCSWYAPIVARYHSIQIMGLEVLNHLSNILVNLATSVLQACKPSVKDTSA